MISESVPLYYILAAVIVKYVLFCNGLIVIIIVAHMVSVYRYYYIAYIIYCYSYLVGPEEEARPTGCVQPPGVSFIYHGTGRGRVPGVIKWIDRKNNIMTVYLHIKIWRKAVCDYRFRHENNVFFRAYDVWTCVGNIHICIYISFKYTAAMINNFFIDKMIRNLKFNDNKYPKIINSHTIRRTIDQNGWKFKKIITSLNH